jgi:hypothetical protein
MMANKSQNRVFSGEHASEAIEMRKGEGKTSLLHASRTLQKDIEHLLLYFWAIKAGLPDRCN